MTSQISKDLELTLRSLKSHNIDARFASTVFDAKTIMLDMIPLNASVGIGDSVTLRQINILNELVLRGNKVINPFTKNSTQYKENLALFIQTCRETLSTNIYVTGANAVTNDGKIVSIDYAGNRVAGSIFGGEKVIIAIGRNKIVQNVDEAVYRIKNVITPFHAKAKNRKTPCAITGICNDCDSQDRLCNVTVILERKPAHTDLTIILIDDDLGLGWNPDWSTQRIDKIKAGYYRNSWAFFTNE